MIFSKEAIGLLESFSEADWLEERDTRYTTDELKEIIADYDACITSWSSPRFAKDVLDRAVKLRFIGHAAGTVVPVVDPSVFERGISVSTGNSALARSTAEMAVAAMMAGAWRINAYSLRLKRDQWSVNMQESVPGLYGATVGLIGYGEISRQVIQLLKPYECRILLHSGFCPQEEAEENRLTLCDLDTLLQESDIVSLHNTLTPRTRGMIGRSQLRKLRDGTLIVNTARGPIIEESALVEELQTGRIHAVLDVFDQEPLPVDHPLLKLDQVLCTPHIAGFSRYWRQRLGLTVIEELQRFVRNEPLQHEITAGKFQRLTPR
jgi:phosphoglycerate dehydrogenase-like enzyme